MRRAAYITAIGGPETIAVGQLPVPRVGPTDVLVAPEALAVDPVDTFIRSGAYRTPMTFPFVLGRDLVGEVVSTGPDVVGFTTGDRVWCNSMGHAGR
ncbi:MAG TPA: alcohol dehydrogenase catalytic domain-containing protein, partial [Phytomonospora sp.]